MAEPLAGTNHLDDAPGLNLEGVTEASQVRALEMATTRIVADLRWDPRQSVRTLNIGVVRYLYPITLPALNVTAVSVVADTFTLEPVSVTWGAGGLVYLDRAVSTSGVVTYTAGWAESAMPAAIVDACVELAAELIENPRRLRTWRVDDVSETYDGVSSRGDGRLDAYRLPPTIA